MRGSVDLHAHHAADAVIVHFDDLFAAVLNQYFIVDILLTELVFNYGNLVTVLLLQDAVEHSKFYRRRASQSGWWSGSVPY